jgi:GT2 family glycosyltransferase
MRIAALYTCFNRKEKTLSSLTNLYKALQISKADLELSVFLTDDNSSDGTSEAVVSRFADVNILKGNGELYWAGGMRNSWSRALNDAFDAYLLLNDDTDVYQDLFVKMIETDTYSRQNFGSPGIYVGTTVERGTDKITYGGWRLLNSFTASMARVSLDSQMPQPCDFGNANIMWVSKSVVSKIGILSEGYVHGMADFDYTYQASKKGLPVLIVPGILGECDRDHGDTYVKFIELSLRERVKMLYNPVGLDFKSQSYHMRKNFPLRWPFFYLTGWFKTLFPKTYYKFQKIRKS